MLGVVERWFSSDRTGSGRPVPCQSLRLVSWAWQTRRAVLVPSARGTHSFPLAMVDEGQWKGMSLTEDLRNNSPSERIPGPGNKGTINKGWETVEGKTHA